MHKYNLCEGIKIQSHWHKQSIGRDGNTIFFFKKSFFYDNDLSQNKQEQKGEKKKNIYIYKNKELSLLPKYP